MKLAAICLGQPEKLPGKSYRTGINKAAISAPVILDRLGLVGDAVCNRKHHGGPDQAVLLEGSLTLDWWAGELGRPMPLGTFGENLVIEGLANEGVAVGDRFHFDAVILEVTSARIPCATLAAKMEEPGFVKRYTKAGRPGIYCRILRAGMLEPGETVLYEPIEGDRISMSELLLTFGKRFTDVQRSRLLAAPVSERLRAAVIAS